LAVGIEPKKALLNGMRGATSRYESGEATSDLAVAEALVTAVAMAMRAVKAVGGDKVVRRWQD
jgi:hypothetical protein